MRDQYDEDADYFESSFGGPWPLHNKLSYEEAERLFLETDRSKHTLGGRVRFVSGKITFLYRMMDVSPERHRAFLVDHVSQLLPDCDWVTQYYVIPMLEQADAMELWPCIEALAITSPKRPICLLAHWTLSRVASRHGAQERLRALLHTPTIVEKQRGGAAMATAKCQIYLDSGPPSLADTLAFLDANPGWNWAEVCHSLRRYLWNRPDVQVEDPELSTSNLGVVACIAERRFLSSGRNGQFVPFLEGHRKLLSLPAQESEGESSWSRFLQLALSDTNPQLRGKLVESLWARLWDGTSARIVQPFETLGEQVDGALELRGFTYLIEIKWHKHRTQPRDVYAFRAKVEGRLVGTRGIFVAMSGFTRDCASAVANSKLMNVILLDGNAIYEALLSRGGIERVLLGKIEEASQRGRVYAPTNLAEVLEPLFLPSAK